MVVDHGLNSQNHVEWDNFYDSGTKLLSFLFSEDSRLTRNALIKTLRKLASPEVSKNPKQGFHISYAMAFGGLREILDTHQDIPGALTGALPGFAKVCFCYGFEVCVALGKGKHDYNGLVRD